MPVITVSLNTSANPPVTVDQPTLEVSSGHQTITWVRAAGQTFTFTALNGLNGPPFSSPSVGANSINISDNNGPGYQNLYAYALIVTYNGQQYGTEHRPSFTEQAAGGPFIHNR